MSSSRAVPSMYDKVFNIVYSDGRFTQIGLDLCSEAGIDPNSLLPKNIKDFETKGQNPEITKMTYAHYEERRQLKLSMINDLYQHMNKKK